jgi:hypothetical protein
MITVGAWNSATKLSATCRNEAEAAARRLATAVLAWTTSRSTGQDRCFATKPVFRRCSPLAIELDDREQS